MQPIEHRHHRLTLRSQPGLAWLGAAVCMGLGLLLALGPKPTTQLTCDRSSQTCTIQARKGIGNYQHHRLPLNHIHKAQLEVPAPVQLAQQLGNRPLDLRSYGVVLYTSQGSLQLSTLSTADYRQREQSVRQINAFIGDAQQPTLTLSEGVAPGVYGMGLLLIALGGLWAATAPRSRVCFDRASGLAQLTWHSGMTDRTYTCQLQDIRGVDLEWTIRRPTSPQPIAKDNYTLPEVPAPGEFWAYRILLTLQDGSQLPLSQSFTPCFDRQRRQPPPLVAIQQFLPQRDLLQLNTAQGVKMD
jgi:hypothetical protein